jgi:molybdopterin adenylyltransferase
MLTAAILTISDTRSAGSRADTTTALMAEILGEAGFAIVERKLVPDEFGDIAAAMRSETAKIQPLAWLSRATAGQVGTAIVINLPGNPKAVRQCLDVVLPMLPHAIQTATDAPKQ